MIIRAYNNFPDDTALRALISEYMSTLPFAIDYQHPEKELEDLGAVYGAAGGGALFVAGDCKKKYSCNNACHLVVLCL